MCIDICTINIRVSNRVRGLHLVFQVTNSLSMSLQLQLHVMTLWCHWMLVAEVLSATIMLPFSDMFIRGAKFSAVTMPWETPLMTSLIQIFGDEYPGARLSMPIDWGSTDLPVAAPVIPCERHWKCSQYVQHKTDPNVHSTEREDNAWGSCQVAFPCLSSP